jgi:hypothetical protein
MTRKLNRWLRSSVGRRAIFGILAFLFVAAIVGQLLGWWSEVFRHLQGTIGGRSPSEVKVAAFTATEGHGQVVLAWTTETEYYNKGFHIYRSEDHPSIPLYRLIRLNQELIPSQVSDEQPAATYEFIDANPDVITTTMYYYWLESVDMDEVRIPQGSVSVEVKPGGTGFSPSHYVFLPLVLR